MSRESRYSNNKYYQACHLPPATAAVVTAVAACHQSRHRPLRLSILRPNNQLQPAVHTAAWYEQNLPQTAASQSTYKLI